MVTDEDIQKAWQKIRNLDLAQMTDGTYQLAATSPSNTGVPNVNMLFGKKMSKEETYQQLNKIYKQAECCPADKTEIAESPTLDRLIKIKRLI